MLRISLACSYRVLVLSSLSKLPTMKKIIFGVLGLALVVGTVGEIPHLAVWGSAEMVGYNATVILGLLGGAYLIYLGLRETN